MKRSSSLRRRVKEIETARGAGAINLDFSDGSKQSFNLTRNECLHVLLASFDIARASRNPDAVPGSSPRAIQVAKQIAHAKEVRPHSALWDSVSAIVQEAENCTSPASDSFSEAKK
jgi:hypothetical protein